MPTDLTLYTEDNDTPLRMTNQQIVKHVLYLSGFPTVTIIVLFAGDFARSIILARSGHLLVSGLMQAIQRSIMTSSDASLTVLQPLLNGDEISDQDVGSLAQYAVVYSVLLSLPLCTILLCSSDILISLGYPRENSELLRQYFYGYAPAVPITLIYSVHCQFYLSKDKPWLLLPLSVLSSVSGILYLYLLDSYTSWGILGIGVAQTLQASTSLVASTLFLWLTPRYQPFQFFNLQLPKARHFLKDLFRYGMPVFFENLGELIANIVISLWMQRMGNSALAAYNISNQYVLFLELPALGLSYALAIQLARLSSPNPFLYHSITPTVLITTGLSSFLPTLAILLAMADPRLFCLPFVHKIDAPENAHLLSQVKETLPLMMTYLIFLSYMKIAIGTLRGLKETLSPFLISMLFTYLIGIGAGAIAVYENGGTFLFVSLQIISIFLSALTTALTAHNKINKRLEFCRDNQLQAAHPTGTIPTMPKPPERCIDRIWGFFSTAHPTKQTRDSEMGNMANPLLPRSTNAPT